MKLQPISVKYENMSVIYSEQENVRGLIMKWDKISREIQNEVPVGTHSDWTKFCFNKYSTLETVNNLTVIPRY